MAAERAWSLRVWSARKSAVPLGGIKYSFYITSCPSQPYQVVMSRGRFVVFEGLDRSGKTTVVNAIYEKLLPATSVERVRFPNREGPIGSIIDGYLQKRITLGNEAIHLMFSADRYEHISRIEGLRKSKIVLCDRYSMSGIAYSAAKGLDLEWCAMSDSRLPRPDLTVFIDVPMDEICRRKGFGEEVHDNLLFLKKVHSSYMRLLEKEENVLVVDGTLSVDEIVEVISQRILG